MSDDNETVQLPLVDESAPTEESSVEEASHSYNFQEFCDAASECCTADCKGSEVLRIEFAGQQFSLEEIGTWSKGQLVSFEEPISSLVRVVVGGALIGHGELIEFEGRVSVRVTEVFDTAQGKAA